MSDPLPTADELRRSRDEIRRSLLRVNTAAGLIVTVVIGLAIAAVAAAVHASRDAALAKEANGRAQEELWKSYLAQASAIRLSGEVGRKAKGKSAVESAAAIRPSLELRNEAIAQMALIDLDAASPLSPLPPDSGSLVFDHSLTHMAVRDSNGLVMLSNVAGGSPATTWPQGIRGSPTGFSPDDRYLAIFKDAAAVTLVDVPEGKVARNLANVRVFDFMPDSRTVVICTNAGDLRFIDIASGRETRPMLTAGKDLRDVLFS